MSFLVATQTIQRYTSTAGLSPLLLSLPSSLRSMGALSILFGQVVRGTSAGARVFEYMALHPSIPLRGGATIPANQIEGRVEFNNVKFAYPTRPEQVTALHLLSSLFFSLSLPFLLLSSSPPMKCVVLFCRWCWRTLLWSCLQARSLPCVDCQEQVGGSYDVVWDKLTTSFSSYIPRFSPAASIERLDLRRRHFSSPSSLPGKSTVAALLERFYDPQQGSVLLDGHPLSSLDPSWVRREVAGYIHQEPVLFATSVMENIRYGRPSATDQEVRGQTVQE